jgi:hypothetical protein
MRSDDDGAIQGQQGRAAEQALRRMRQADDVAQGLAQQLEQREVLQRPLPRRATGGGKNMNMTCLNTLDSCGFAGILPQEAHADCLSGRLPCEGAWNMRNRPVALSGFACVGVRRGRALCPAALHRIRGFMPHMALRKIEKSIIQPASNP